jgi:PKD repeat protein
LAHPVAGFTAASNSQDDVATYEFDDNPADLDGEMVRWFWDFGDGAYPVGGPSADFTYVHTYTEVGSFTVILYVIDDDGSMSSVR